MYCFGPKQMGWGWKEHNSISFRLFVQEDHPRHEVWMQQKQAIQVILEFIRRRNETI